MPPQMKVVVAYPPRIDPVELGIVSGIDGVEVVHAPYEEPYESRTARRHGRQPVSVADLEELRRSAFGRAVGDADAIFALDLPTQLRALAPRLRWVHAVGAGTEHLLTVDLAPSVVITNSSGVASRDIAEFVVARLLSMWKQFPRLAEQQRRHDWSPVRGQRVRGKTVAVVGFGAIGQQVAVLATALGMRVLGVRRHPEPHPAAEEVRPPAELHDVLARADAVVLCASLNETSRGLIDAEAIGALPRGAILCNVGRGLTVDEGALVDALQSGHLAAAALDVVAEEPLRADSPLWDTPSLHLSPHCSGSGPEDHVRSALQLFVDNVRRWQAGQPLKNVVGTPRTG